MNNKKLPRVNREIINRELPNLEIRLLGETGEMLGVMGVRDAIRIAESKGLDLVEISPNSNPIVCKIADFGKMKYDMQKKTSEERKRNKIHDSKEVKFTLNIAQHDFQVKMNHVKEFITTGHSVKISCAIRGRDRANGKTRLQPLFEKILNDSIEFGATMNGKMEVRENGGEFTIVPKK